ncbi:hypothetical protein F5I97DRAFT_1829119 [Phlebopus sp. FC_14]|nr:hypothetical protein F5I97DRAFT_1829119 [Phlebopus sp. FC_14]
MVHRPPDSRLLTNLITHEKEYSKHLAALFPLSHTALASLSAYAATFPSPRPYSPSPKSPAQTLAAIVDVLASADDALQRYNQATDAWREQLVHLKDLEDEVGAVLRDREILFCDAPHQGFQVTKPSRDARSSLIIHVGTGSTSFTSLPSTNSTTAGSANSKLAHAQAELQACEAHLAAKEQELELGRLSVARDGLGARCRALIDCGWVWGEMGKEGLRALQALRADSNSSPGELFSSNLQPIADPVSLYGPLNQRSAGGQPFELKSFPRTQSQSPSRSSGRQKPLPSPALPLNIPQGPTSHSSDISLTPSQSVSQIAGPSVETSQETHRDLPGSSRVAQKPQDESHGDITIHLPPAHAISDLALPTGSSRTLPNGHAAELKKDASASAPPRRRHRQQPVRPGRPLSRRISEVPDEDENIIIPPIVSASNFLTDLPSGVFRTDESSEEDVTQGPLEIVENKPFGQAKRFSLRPGVDAEAELSPERKEKRRERKSSMAFFGSLRGLFKHKGKDKGYAEWEKALPTGKKGKGGWVTRTDAHLRGSEGRDSSDSELDSTPRAPPPLGSAKLRKGRTTDPPLFMLVAAPNARRSLSPNCVVGTAGHTDGELDRAEDSDALPGSSSPPVRKSLETAPRAQQSQPRLSSAASNRLSRTSSLSRGSIMSAPATMTLLSKSSTQRTTVGATSESDTGILADSLLSGRSDPRSISAVHVPLQSHPDESHSTSLRARSKPRRNGKSGGSQIRHGANGSGNKSLMSVVEDVARQNREGWGITSVPLSPVHDGTYGKISPRSPTPEAPTDRRQHYEHAEGKKSRSLDLPRAPSSVIPASQSPPISAHSRTTSSPPTTTTQAVSSPRLALVNGTASSRPAKSPLRSALRNSSRTPSPRPVQPVEIRGRHVRAQEEEDPERPRGRTPERELPSPRDSASISSYVTGRESPEPDEPVAPSPSPPPVPPHDKGDTPSNASTETPPVRRKSVRVSLQPTFSPTPPALYENDDDVSGRYAPWSSLGAPSKEGWNMKNGSAFGDDGRGDLWQDSSEEDEEYSRARRLLSRVGKKGKG